MAAMAFPLCVNAQEKWTTSNVKPKSVVIKRENGTLNANMDVALNDLQLKSQLMLYLRPLIVNGMDTVAFSPIVVKGNRRNKSLERLIDFDGFEYKDNPEAVIKYEKKENQIYSFTLSTPYQEWMRDAALVLLEQAEGCACRDEYQDTVEVIYPLLKSPKFIFPYKEPPAEEIKERSDRHKAYINFEVAKYKLLPNYKNNAQVLAEVEKIVSEVKNDQNLTINELMIRGFASPEGGFESNITLSENRAKAFVEYLREKYRGAIPGDLMKVDWEGEDWIGFKRQMIASNYHDKAAVLDVLSTVSSDSLRRNIEKPNGKYVSTDPNDPNNSKKKAALKKLSNGKTYREVLADYYPVLRRNDYIISYITKPFSVEEAREVIKTKPQHLSLNEMYHVANSYPKDSQDFKRVMDIIAHFYPKDETAILNRAIYDIENQNYDLAIEKLSKINTGEASNALGVAYYYKNDYQRAGQFFNRAANAGTTEGSYNLKEFNDSMTNEQSYNQMIVPGFESVEFDDSSSEEE